MRRQTGRWASEVAERNEGARLQAAAAFDAWEALVADALERKRAGRAAGGRLTRRAGHRAPLGEILRLLNAGDTTCTRWVPHAPVRLYAVRGDTQVTYLNSVNCQRAMDAHGLHEPLIDVGNVDHFPSERDAADPPATPVPGAQLVDGHPGDQPVECRRPAGRSPAPI